MKYDTLYLVINNSTEHDMALPYRHKYKLFTNSGVAFAYAKSVGFDSPMEPEWEPGVMDTYKAGEIEIGLIAIEVTV